MCYIYTNSSENLFKDYRIISQHLADKAEHNFDGFTLLFLGLSEADDLLIRTMNYKHFETSLKSLIDLEGQIFIHFRFATTYSVGLGYTHGFDNLEGMFYMHNGSISNKTQLHVDSFNLISTKPIGPIIKNERFANIFEIDSIYRCFTVHRKIVGSLYTDGETGYSTNPIGCIKIEIPIGYEKSIVLDAQVNTIQDDWFQYNNNGGNYGKI